MKKKHIVDMLAATTIIGIAIWKYQEADTPWLGFVCGGVFWVGINMAVNSLGDILRGESR